MTISLLTFGCRLNAHESDGMAHYARQTSTDRRTIIVNTCTVTAEAERQARQAIRRAGRQHPDATIVVTGCASERNPETWKALPGVQRVVPNREKLSPATWGVSGDITDTVPQTPPSRHIRALLPVQQGCNHRCTFCVIPFGRGKASSTPLADLISRARALTEAGHQEIVLTGVDIASWQEGENGLGALCRALLADNADIRRLRLSSIDPILLDPETGDRALWALLADEPRFMPHLHLSLQAGADLILKRMKRRHTTMQVRHLMGRIRTLRPDTGFGADLIAGFPTEGDALFEETYNFVTEQAIAFLHVFPYSERPGTPAARMPALPHTVRQKRASALRALGERTRDIFLARFVGQEKPVLLESTTTGHTPEFAKVQLAEGQEETRGTIENMRITSVGSGKLFGKIIHSSFL